jgi:Cu+-exporting ATPase
MPAVQANLSVDGMNCASCVSHVQRDARGVAGVISCAVNPCTGRAALRFDPSRTSARAAAAAAMALSDVTVIGSALLPRRGRLDDDRKND